MAILTLDFSRLGSMATPEDEDEFTLVQRFGNFDAPVLARKDTVLISKYRYVGRPEKAGKQFHKGLIRAGI